MNGSRAIRSRHIVTSSGVFDGAVLVRDGLIEMVVDPAHVPAGVEVLDLGSWALMPGVVDTHVHVNDPGRSDWEGWHTASRAAAAGGVTTIVDMPLNSIPPTTTVAGLNAKLAAATGTSMVDFGLWGGAVPDNVEDMRALAAAGVCGFKCFLVDPGVPEFGRLEPAGLEAAMRCCAALDLPLLVHTESADELLEFDGPARSHSAWMHTRPAAAELRAAELVWHTAMATGCHAHVVHVSHPGTCDYLVRQSEYTDTQLVTCETCPHYIGLCSEQVPDGATHFKCAPPIRTAEDRDGLLAALVAGHIDIVASDHSPAPPDTKCVDTGDFEHAWGGIASLQLTLPLLHTIAGSRLGLERIAHLLSYEPAQLAGLASKGQIEPGRDADLVAFDTDATWTVDGASLEHRHPLTPWHGRTLHGRVELTMLRGRTIYDRRGGGLNTGTPAGRPLLRTP